MASSVLTVVFLLVVGLSMLQAESNKCRTLGKGKLETFYGATAYMKMPCKHDLATFNCHGYDIHVAPGEAFDSRGRIYTKTVWISIKKGDFRWKARTSSRRVERHNKTMGQPGQIPVFEERDPNRTYAPFQILIHFNSTAYSATVYVPGAVEITYYAYIATSKEHRRKNGVEILCSIQEDEEDETFLTNLCGNNTESGKAIAKIRRNLNLNDKKQVLMHQTLKNEKIIQVNAQCEKAQEFFLTCEANERDQSAAIKNCAVALTDKKLMSHLANGNDNPMDLFVHCLGYICNSTAESCEYIKETLIGSSVLLNVAADCLPVENE